MPKNRTLLLLHEWPKPSEVFIQRHMNILADAGTLSCIMLRLEREDREWQGVPVYGMREPRYRPTLRDRLVWFKNRVQRRLKLGDYVQRFNTLWIRRVMHQRRINTILCQYANAATSSHYYEMLRTTKHPVFIQVHGYDIIRKSAIENPEQQQRFRTLANRHYILCNSQYMHDMLVTHWSAPSERIFIKPCGIDIPTQTVQHPPKSEVTILYLGRLIDFKGPDLTIRAFERACERGLNGRLIIAGDGKLMPVCRELVENSPYRDRITLTGAVTLEEGDQLRQQADIFTHHARDMPHGAVETFGVAIVEAMAVGLPVVTCPLGGIKETVIGGETGIFFNSEDIEAQADALLQLANDHELRARLGAAGRERVKALYSLEQERDTLLQILGR